MQDRRTLLILCCVGCLFSSLAFAAPTAIEPGSWTLAILPDSQNYETNGYFAQQTNFLASYKNTLNLGYVLSEGDLTNGNTANQWTVASNAIQTLDNAGINYTLATGNHDYTGNSDYRTTSMAGYFPTSRLAAHSTYGGSFATDDPTNTYSLSAGGVDWVVVSMEFGVRDSVLQWADGILDTYSSRKAIVLTHAYMYSDNTRYDYDVKGETQRWNPRGTEYAIGENDGEDIWTSLKDNANLQFVFNGHVINDGTGYLASTGDNGNVVHQALANYQGYSNGGQGYMRLLEFLPDGQSVHVRTYSPVLDSYLTTADQDFIINLNEVPATKPTIYSAIASNIVVTAGTTVDPIPAGGISVTQSSSPIMGILQANKGDYQVKIDNLGMTYTDGIMLASITQNVRDGLRATVEIGRDSFKNGYLSHSVTRAGAATLTEVNFNVATAAFRYQSGWQGAHVTGTSSAVVSSSTGVTQSMVTRTGTGRYQVQLGTGRTPSNGLLFAIGNNNSNYIASTSPIAGGGWNIRTQNNYSSSTTTGLGTDADFSFLYVPLDTPGLIGGCFDGASGTSSVSAGEYTLARVAAGTYRLTIPSQSALTGMLIMSVCKDEITSGVAAPADNFLVYEGVGSDFLIYSYDLTGSSTVSLEDTTFSWAFINFANPIATQVPEPSSLAGVFLVAVALVGAASRRFKHRS